MSPEMFLRPSGLVPTAGVTVSSQPPLLATTQQTAHLEPGPRKKRVEEGTGTHWSWKRSCRLDTRAGMGQVCGVCPQLAQGGAVSQHLLLGDAA